MDYQLGIQIHKLSKVSDELLIHFSRELHQGTERNCRPLSRNATIEHTVGTHNKKTPNS